MDSNYEDSDDSSLFLKSIGSKRKASAAISQKNSKQAKLNFPQLTATQNTESNAKEIEISDLNPTGKNNFFEGDDKDGAKPSSSSWKSVENDSELNESRSSYFNEKKPSNTCPLCLKRFETDSGYAMHMKQCAKKRKMTTQQLLTALDLQKKQMQERRALGLSSQIVAPKKSIPKKKVKEDPQSDYHLALGIALSKSLDVNEAKTEVQKSSLKEFGFTYNAAGPSKKKSKDLRKWVLKERTPEERQRIVTEKAAVVLLDEDDEKNSGNVVVTRNSSSRDDQLTKFQDRVPRLWNLGENEDNMEWYVNDMKELLKVDGQEAEGKGNEKDKNEGKEKEEENHPRRTSITEDNLAREIEKLKLPKEGIHLDWQKMINNDKLSDLFGRTKDSESVYMHSLVLHARCPDLLEKDKESVFSKFSLSTILVFLEYLYCGTLNGLTVREVDDLSKLALDLDYRELINVLNGLEKNLTRVESSEEVIPSSDEDSKSDDNEIAVIEEKEVERKEKEEEEEEEEVTIVPDDKDLFAEEMVDLTQSNQGSSVVDEDEDGDADGDGDGDEEDEGDDDDEDEVESNADKSYWSFLQQEKRREEVEEEMRRREEERENSIISVEMEKIETSMKQRNEMMQRILNEFEEDESDFKRKFEFGDSARRRRRSSSDSTTKDLFEVFKKKEVVAVEECIVLSSDSETRASKGEEEGENAAPTSPANSKPEIDIDSNYEVPYFDPYENVNNFSGCNFSPVDHHSQSLVSDVTSFSSPLKKKISNEGVGFQVEEESGNCSNGPEYFSTPVMKRSTISRIRSSVDKSQEKRRKRKSDLGASRIIRKSLGLKARNTKSNSAKKKSTKRRESCREGKDLAKVLTDSVLNELSSSIMMKTSTPVHNRLVEMTPKNAGDVTFGESMTPSPNFSIMGESMLKEHLSKYGLKKSLAKTKARKILRHIYEELHPILNTETGKFVKMLPSENSKGRKKAKPKKAEKKTNPTKKTSTKQKDLETATQKRRKVDEISSKDADQKSDGSGDSFERSTDYDSEGSEFEDIEEPLTQSAANNPVDLPSALSEFLQRNPEFHQKILLYEPIWLEELQRQLKESFQKHFKLADIMDYLDQKCVTFRSEAQKKGNQKKNVNGKKVKQSKEKKDCSS